MSKELESIDNATLSEALGCLEKLTLLTCNIEWHKDNINIIKQALIKAQKEHKVLDIIKEKRVDIESFYTSFIEGEYDYDFYEIRYGTYGKYCLTEEEFNLLKAVLE